MLCTRVTSLQIVLCQMMAPCWKSLDIKKRFTHCQNISSMILLSRSMLMQAVSRLTVRNTEAMHTIKDSLRRLVLAHARHQDLREHRTALGPMILHLRWFPDLWPLNGHLR
jgi:hypothetical protein